MQNTELSKVMDLRAAIVAAYGHAGILDTPDTAIVEEWFQSIPNFDPTLALACVKAQLASMGEVTFKPLNYFEPRIRQKHNNDEAPRANARSHEDAMSNGQNTDQDPILQFFVYEHLPPHLKEVSSTFAEVARWIVQVLPRNPERTVALRKLLEAKDAAVRARLFK